jgi:hypothetical protein
MGGHIKGGGRDGNRRDAANARYIEQLWAVGGPTRELGPVWPRPEGPSTTQTNIRSLSLGRFLGGGGGSEEGDRQDPISVEMTWWGLMLTA